MNTNSRIDEGRVAGVGRSEPVGREKPGAGDARASAGHPPLPGLAGGGLGDRPELSDELIDELLAGAQTAQEIAGPDGLLGQLTRRLLERALEAEMTEHVGYEHGHAPPGGTGNARNGRPAKTVLTDQGTVRIRSPRDRNSSFEPQIVAKRQTRWVGFEEKVIAMYAPRDDGPRHPGTPLRDLRHRRQRGPGLEDHRRRPGRRQGVADHTQRSLAHPTHRRNPRTLRPHRSRGFVPLAEAAKRLGVARQTVLHQVQRGERRATHVTQGRRTGLRIEVPAADLGLIGQR